jgi:hypothetical protein
MMTDKEFKTMKRELLRGSGLSSNSSARKNLAHWIDCLHKVGAPIWARYGRYPGPYDIDELRERLVDDPDLLAVFEDSYRISKAEVDARMRAAGWPIQ